MSKMSEPFSVGGGLKSRQLVNFLKKSVFKQKVAWGYNNSKWLIKLCSLP
jgi:hypothetical protein